jgi:hypothetical protein
MERTPLATYTADEWQRLVFAAKSFSQLRKLYGLSEADVRELRMERGVKTPKDFVNEAPAEEIMATILAEGSLASAARRYGLSTTVFKRIMRRRYSRPAGSIPESKEELEKQIKAARSVRAFALFNDVSVTTVRRAIKEHKIALAPLLKYDHGTYESAKGRKGELAFKEWRGLTITKDFNESEDSTAPADLEDTELKLINVKGSAQFKYTTKKRRFKKYWRFNLHSIEKVDTVGLVAFDSKYDKPVWFAWIDARELDCLKGENLTVSERAVRHIADDGRITLDIIQRNAYREHATEGPA